MAAVASARRAQASRLRVGLFADARLQPRWVVEAFDRVAQSGFAEIALIQVSERRAAPAPWLWQLYAKLDRMAFGDDGAERVDLARLGKLGCGHDPAQHELDVAFVLGTLDDRAYDGVARYGVWRFCFGAQRAHAEPLAGLREVAEAAPLTGSGIKVRPAPGAPARLAYESWSRTYPLSVARNRAQLLRKTSEFAWRALRELHRSGGAWLERLRPLPEEQAGGQAPAPPAAGPLAAIGGRILRRGLEKALYREQWFLAWRFGGEEARAAAPDLAGWTRALPPRDRIWADPFAIEKNGRHFVFFEELPFAEGKAHIAMIEVKRDGSFSLPVRVLERSFHLSYPFLFEQDGELYLVPESAQNRSVDLYRCVDFPLRWKHAGTLLDGVRLVDATLHREPGGWWMFANAAASGSSVFDDELHVFHAGALLGQWRAHPRNPVRSDARCARPAGQLFRRGGHLYRPAQICVPRYGAGLAIHRVLRLTPHDYAERQVRRILPGGGLLGLHTVNRAGDLTVTDAFARRSRLEG